ncbi:putative pro-pol polyprotein [Trichonephila clavipes]|nr:putative pro-pol polyprotein [Trichonephila clavipes]
MGKVPRYTDKRDTSMNIVTMLSQEDIPVSSLWDLEMLGIRDTIEQNSREEKEKAVMSHFLETVREWLAEGVIEEIPGKELPVRTHYLPHRPVIKETSATSLMKIRQIFDASAKINNHPSLNDCLETGNNLIESVPAILARFRLKPIGVISDIRRAFLQISLHEKDRDFVRFLWYDNEGNIQTYRHSRVAFGVTSSPFFLMAVINYHLLKESVKERYSEEFLKKLQDSFYVDNCVTSVQNNAELRIFVESATNVMKEGMFDLRGWESSDIPSESTTSLVLGLIWDKNSDTLEIDSESLKFDEKEKITKRKILSLVSRVFDPIGVLEESNLSIHTFVDASKTAYAACIFLRSESNTGSVTVQLLQARSRITPMKTITIPRLELMATTIGARLFSSVKHALKISNIKTYFWTDSSTVLLIRREQWSIFVANRISEIRKLTTSEDWFHISTDQNLADILSRGCGPKQLQKRKWWPGPDWLKNSKEQWPKSAVNINEKEVEIEKRKSQSSLLITQRRNITIEVRLINEEESKDFISPIILPSKHLAVRRFIAQEHLVNKHAGTLTLLTILRERFWIVKGKRTVRSVIKECLTCKRQKTKHLEVPFPPLPKDRTEVAALFQVSGVDLAGPLLTKSKQKAWIVLFTCAVFRAVLLELITSLNTTDFIQAMRRFIARRGRISVMYSDNGTNFTGLNNALRQLDWTTIESEFRVHEIRWKFNPPSSPWWGGFWERLIGILKDLLRKNLGRSCLSYEELQTLVCECESVMNSRPLTYISSMFLQDIPLNDVPDLDQIQKTNIVLRWRYIQKVRENLKQRFKREYLGFLRSSVIKREDKINEGDIVLIGTDDKKRLHWLLGRVLELFPGKDGIIRLVKLRTERGDTLRPIQRLYPLEVTSNQLRNL